MLFAVLISIIVLAVGASIVNIALKQIVLSGVGRESQYAFYAANTGIECAIYWDLNHDVFAEVDGNLGLKKDTAKCAGVMLLGDGKLESEGSDGEKAISTFKLSMLPAEDRCVDVTVEKLIENNAIASTTVISRGYNTCDEKSPRRTERGLRITY